MEAIKEASDKAPSLKYQGRKTSRAGSEQRRKAILEAALRIVVREGVRGVRHRAVAKEADVPLSATTYYFKDISDLITDTFTLFVEVGTDKYRSFWDESEEVLSDALHQIRDVPEKRPVMMAFLIDLVVRYLRKQLLEHRDYLLAEQAFRLECLRNDNLKTIASKHAAYLHTDLKRLFSEVGSKAPDMDAVLMTELIFAAEYKGLMLPSGVFDEQGSRSLVSRGLQHMLHGVFEEPLSH
ncbi:TetR/AcrR family transcriptional regulator [Sansalvadorimonas verongulae]|uniref:TetR/AcrR family transcriptional regulator n=1 Tax=Sansalvadorimonas verongulae TaxID=2172824 RepID=UPI0012BC0392|nr:TetR family transcriptional regulator [Sansalvadorimonas verongulae]MTI14098.1 TetR family transcriptional regulator [Sansalvadorimonas verongulae]